jgi:hypothetical protein
MNNVRVLQRELYRAAKAQKERRFGVYCKHRRGMCDILRDLYRESGCTDYGERCDDMRLNTDR